MKLSFHISDPPLSRLEANSRIYVTDLITTFFAFKTGRNMVVKKIVLIFLIGLFTVDLAQIGASGKNRFKLDRNSITPETPSAPFKTSYDNNGNIVCVFECTIPNLATYRQFTNAAWDWIIQKKKKKNRKDIKIALSLGYPNSFFYNKRCNMLL